MTKGPWSLHADATSALVRWEACAQNGDPNVVFAPEAGGAEIAVASSATAFDVPETFTAPLNTNAPPDYKGTYYLHEASLTGLSPGTCYRYHLAAEPSREGRFCTSRASGDPFTFLAIGDTNPGLGTYAHDVLTHALPYNPDFTLHGGDVQYYDSGLETWASWFPVMQPMLSQGAFFPSIGNHEHEKPGEYEAYIDRFFGGAGFDGTRAYYRFEWGGIWFFALDTESPLDVGDTQGGWLVAQLEDAASKPGFRASIVYFHKPFVTCGDTGDNPNLRAKYEPIFLQYGVTMVLQAHMHGYERFEIGGLTYVTTAGGGGLIGNVDENTERSYCVDRVSSGGFRHALVIDIDGGGLHGRAIDDQGMVRDAFDKIVP